MLWTVVGCCFLDAGSVAAFDTSLWKLEKPKLVQEVKVSFFLNPVMFFSVFAMSFVTELWTAVMCWKTKQGCNKMAIFVCIMQVHFGSLGRFGLLAAFCGYGWCEASGSVD